MRTALRRAHGPDAGPALLTRAVLQLRQETDGGQAIVVTSAERARDLPQPPAVIVAARWLGLRGAERDRRQSLVAAHPAAPGAGPGDRDPRGGGRPAAPRVLRMP